MTQDKSNTTEKHAEIAFNWERTKKKAKEKLDELVCNAPRITKREEREALARKTERLVANREVGRTLTTDTRIDPPIIPSESDYNTHSLIDDCIVSQECNTPNQVKTPQPTSGDSLSFNTKTDNKTNNHINHTNDHIAKGTSTTESKGTSTTTLLAAAPAHEKREVLTNESAVRGEVIPSEKSSLLSLTDYGPDKNAIDLLKEVKSGAVVGSELPMEDRRIVVQALRHAGQTQDSISSLLKVSRRTIVKDCKYLREVAAMEIANTETSLIAGEVYTTAKAAMEKALQKGQLKTVSTLMRDMVELLQSMGFVYRAPKTSMQATMHGKLNTSQGYNKYLQTIGEDKEKVIDVLDVMFNAIADEKV